MKATSKQHLVKADASHVDGGVHTLHDVNVPPSPTWNYLNINGLTIQIQAPEDAMTATSGTTTETSPAVLAQARAHGHMSPDMVEAFKGVELGCGEDTSNWIDAHADAYKFIHIDKGATQTLTLAIDDENLVATSNVYVDESATLDLCIIESVGFNAQALTNAAVEPTAGQATEPTRASTTLDSKKSAGHNLRLIIGADAKVTLRAFITGTSRTYLHNTGIKLLDGAKLEAHTYLLSGDMTCVGCVPDLYGTHSQAELTARYLVGDKEHLDMNYVARMRGHNSQCDMSFSGVLQDGGEKTLRDTIDLIHGAKGAAGVEDETVVLAGKNLINRSMPVVLCNEDDVAGNHGSTIGAISPEQLVYLTTRGLTEADAIELVSRAVCDDAYLHANRELAQQQVLATTRRAFGEKAVNDLLLDTADE